MCGLTERTLRNYLKMGILNGQKECGVWHFSPEQIAEFMSNDYVRAAMKSKRTAIFIDYINDTYKKENSMCIVLDLPQENSEDVAKFFCQAVNKRSGLRMTYDKIKGLNRVVMIGGIDTVYDILNEYYSRSKL